MNVSVVNIVISKLIEADNNSRCLIRYLDVVIRPLTFILDKMSGYVKYKEGDKDNNYFNKLFSFHIDDDKLLENYESIWTKIEDLQSHLLIIYLFIKTNSTCKYI